MSEREAGDDLTIRSARSEDLDALARLHVLVWRDTYRLLAPASAYEALDESKRRRHWEELLQRDPAQWQTVVAEHDGRRVGSHRRDLRTGEDNFGHYLAHFSDAQQTER